MKDFDSLGMSGEEYKSQHNENGRPAIDGHTVRLIKRTLADLVNHQFAGFEDILLSKFRELSLPTISPYASEYIWIPNRDIFERLEIANILRLEASGSYTIFHLVNGETCTCAQVIKTYEQKLSAQFVRIHKSHLVNIDKIIRLNPGRKAEVELTVGDPLPVSRDRMVHLKKVLLG